MSLSLDWPKLITGFVLSQIPTLVILGLSARNLNRSNYKGTYFAYHYSFIGNGEVPSLEIHSLSVSLKTMNHIENFYSHQTSQNLSLRVFISLALEHAPKGLPSTKITRSPSSIPKQ